MTGMVICQDDARNTTGCGNGHLQDGDSAAIRMDCWVRMTYGHPNGLGRGNPTDLDTVRECREHLQFKDWTTRLKGTAQPSPFLILALHNLYPPMSPPMHRSLQSGTPHGATQLTHLRHPGEHENPIALSTPSLNSSCIKQSMRLVGMARSCGFLRTLS